MIKYGKHKPYRVLILISIIFLLLSACVPKIEKLVEEGDTETLIKLLGYKRKAEVRAEAAQALGELGTKEAVDPLIERLSDEDETVRAAAAVALGAIGDESAIPTLINLLKDESEVACEGAVEGLVLFGVKAVDPVIGSLSSGNPSFREALVNVLSGIGKPAIPSLLDALSNPVQNVEQGAKDALVAMGSTAAEFLISHFTNFDSDIHGKVEAILIEMEMDAVPSLINALDDPDQTVAEMAHEALVEIGEPAVQSLIDALQDEDLTWKAGDVLVEIGDPAVDMLIDALSDSDVQVQVGDVLIYMGETAIDDLISAYQSNPEEYSVILRSLVHGLRLDDMDIREDVHAILVELGEEAVPEILAMSSASFQVSVGGETFIAYDVLYSQFGTIRGELVDGGFCEEMVEVAGQIVLCQRGENYFVEKVMAVQEGGGIGVIIYNNTEGALNPTLGEDNETSIMAVGLTMEEGMVLLESALGEETLLVSEDVSQVPFTLAEIGTPAIPYLLESIRNEESVDLVDDALIEMGSAAVPALLDAFEEEEALVLVQLIYVMGELGDERFNEPVIEALAHEDPLVREEAAYALAKMMLEESIEPLIERLMDEEEDVADAAAYALTKIGLPAVEPLLTAYYEGEYVLSNIAEDVLRDIFEDNNAEVQEMAENVCAGVSQPDASEYSRYESDIHPLVVSYFDGDPHYWTDYVPVDWLPFTPEDLELVVCVTSQEKQVVQVCQYVYTGSGSSAPSITRYRYEMTAKIYAAQTGYLVGSTTLRGSSPDYCPYSTSSYTTSITGDYVSMDDFRTWIAVYGIDLEK